MTEYITSLVTDYQQLNSTLGIFLYWIPAILCLIGFTLRSIVEYRQDVGESVHSYYRPQLTVGLLVLRVVASVLPGWNLLVLLFNVGYDMLAGVLRFFGELLNIPLVPKRYDTSTER